MNSLPKWVISNPFPAIHDFESLTVLEQVARVYGAVNELIAEYNKTVEQLDKYEKQETAAREEFELNITKVMNEFMCSMENYLKTNIENTATETLRELIDSGIFTVNIVYNEETEALTVSIVTGGENDGI